MIIKSKTPNEMKKSIYCEGNKLKKNIKDYLCNFYIMSPKKKQGQKVVHKNVS